MAVKTTNIQHVSHKSYTAVIPKFIMREMGLDKGDSLTWEIKGDKLMVTPQKSIQFKHKGEKCEMIMPKDREGCY